MTNTLYYITVTACGLINIDRIPIFMDFIVELIHEIK